MPTTLTLEQRTQTRGPASFAVLMPQFEKPHLISDLQSYRLTDEISRHQGFYAGDGVGYGLKDDNNMLYLTDAPNNPLLKDPKSSAQSLISMSQRNFFVNPTDAKDLEAKAAASSGVVAFNLSSQGFQRHLQRFGGEYPFIEVSTAKLAEGREAFKQEYGDEVTDLFDRVHGEAIYGSNGIGALLLKEKQPKETTRIYVLNNEYVRNTLQSKERGTVVARASYVCDFGDHSVVYLDVWGVDGRRLVRGVVNQETAEGGAPQKVTEALVVQSANQELVPYDEALKVAERYAPKTSPLFPALQGMLKEIYRIK